MARLEHVNCGDEQMTGNDLTKGASTEIHQLGRHHDDGGGNPAPWFPE